MTAPDTKNRDERLAEALRANLRRRKAANAPQKTLQDAPVKPAEPV